VRSEHDGLVVRRLQVAIDCVDPERLAAFWATVLGYVIDAPPVGFASWQDFSRSDGGVDESWSAVVDPLRAGPRVLFHRVPEPKVGKNRVHLDVRVSAANEVSAETRRRQVDAEVARLQNLGGIHLRTEEDDYDYFAVMTDPEGNEFCIN
jgi:Glyoxalase-like domain